MSRKNCGVFPTFRGRAAAVALAALSQPHSSCHPPGSGHADTATEAAVVTGGNCLTCACQCTSIARLCRQQLGISVGAYHQQLRLTIARQRLRQDIGSERAARSAGFSSSRQLHSTRNADSSVFFHASPPVAWAAGFITLIFCATVTNNIVTICFRLRIRFAPQQR